MPRVKGGYTSRRRHKKVLSAARGFHGSSHRNYRRAKEALLHAWNHAYRDRKDKKGDFRRLWIIRIGAGSRALGLPYSQFMHGLKLAGIEMDRKMLADLVVNDSAGFEKLVQVATEELSKK